jgi:hypothetical protein
MPGPAAPDANTLPAAPGGRERLWPQFVSALVVVCMPTAFVAWLGASLPPHTELGGGWTRVGWAALGTASVGLVLHVAHRLTRRSWNPYFAMYCVLFVPLTLWNLASVVNVRLDTSPPRPVRLRFVSHTQPVKGASYDTLAVEGSSSFTFDTHHTVSAVDAVPGARFRAELHDGRLGIPWYTGLRRDERP